MSLKLFLCFENSNGITIPMSVLYRVKGHWHEKWTSTIHKYWRPVHMKWAAAILKVVYLIFYKETKNEILRGG